MKWNQRIVIATRRHGASVRGHLDEIVEKRSPAAKIGQGGAGGGIDVTAVAREAAPVNTKAHDHAGPHRIADHGAGPIAAAVVENPRPLAVANIAPGRVVEM